jgi:hypothetical protein
LASQKAANLVKNFDTLLASPKPKENSGKPQAK